MSNVDCGAKSPRRKYYEDGLKGIFRIGLIS
jgi:hypothetical protein